MGSKPEETKSGISQYRADIDSSLSAGPAGQSSELGKERAETLVRKAIGDVYRRLDKEWVRTRKSADVGSNMASAFAAFANGDALDYRVREQAEDVYGFDVTRCPYAEFYRELGEPELGFLLVCSMDFPFVSGVGPDLKLTRTQTLMQGASYCDFRYTRQQS
jgi:hypothetical protein